MSTADQMDGEGGRENDGGLPLGEARRISGKLARALDEMLVVFQARALSDPSLTPTLRQERSRVVAQARLALAIYQLERGLAACSVRAAQKRSVSA